MKIVGNISSAFKIYNNIKYLNKFKKNIEKARIIGNNQEEREFILKATSLWGKKMVETFNINLDVIGRENLPKNSPIVYMANHQGYADIVVLCATLDTIQYGYIARDGLGKVPLYGKWIDRIRSIMINRKNPREGLKSINKAISLIREGYSFLIFPEGTRSRCEKMNNFKPGAMKIATKPQVPIIPISLDGTWKIFEEKGKVQSADVKIMIHKPIYTDNLTREEEKSLSDKIHNIIEDGLKELRK